MKEEKSAAVTMEQFFTRERANEGIDLPLYLPDGTKTTHSIKIRGIDSDIFKDYESESQRRIMDSSIDLRDKENLVKIMARERRATIASLVISWTFDRPCTHENVVELFTQAPQIEEQVDRLASKRSLFFKIGSLNSTPSPVQSSS